MSKAWVMAIVMLLVMAGGAVVVRQSFSKAQERPAVQRLDSERRLTLIAKALAEFRAREKRWPNSMGELIKAQHLGFGINLVRGGGTYRYRRPAENADENTIIVWSDRCHDAVHVGQPWGAQGEVAIVEHPEVSFVITAALRVEQIDHDQWLARIPHDADVGVERAQGVNSGDDAPPSETPRQH